MSIKQGEFLLAELQGETARAWQSFADVNQVSLESLLDALGPILHRADVGRLRIGQALREAIADAR